MVTPCTRVHVYARVSMCVNVCTHVRVPLAVVMLREGHTRQAEGHYLRKGVEVGKYKALFGEQGGNVVSRFWQGQVRACEVGPGAMTMYYKQGAP